MYTDPLHLQVSDPGHVEATRYLPTSMHSAKMSILRNMGTPSTDAR